MTLRKLFFALAFSFATPAALAAPVGIDGFDPLITLGFNPQPEPPPAYTFVLEQQVNPFDVVAQVSGISPQPFTTAPFSGISPTPFLLSLTVSEGLLVPPEPVVPIDNAFELTLRTGGESLMLAFSLFFPEGTPMRATVASQSSGPQSLEILLGLANATGVGSPDAVAVKMQVFDGDQLLGVSAVPLPPALLLFSSALLGLVGFSKRRKAS